MDTEKPAWILKEKIFSEDNMFTRMLGYAIEENLTETYRALYYASEKHAGQTRRKNAKTKESIPYIIHPLMMACHAHALGIRDDYVLATILLHDVCEDCGVEPQELPFADAVRHSVALLTKKSDYTGSVEDKKEYYDGIITDKTASVVKCLDRCNNVCLMALSFTREKIIEYVEETQEYIYPILDKIKYEYPEYNDVSFLIKYQIRSTLETIKVFILGG